MKLHRALALLALSWQAAACQSAPPPATGPASPTVARADTSYNLGPGDKLRLITFGEERLSGEFTVNERGLVSLPLIGDIRAGGLTLESFSGEVRTALANGYLNNPRVSVEVLNYRPFYILGEVAKPGEYPFINGLTVINAVATAGGFSYRANIHKVFVRGQNETKEHVESLTSLSSVHPGDTIRIPERLF